MTTMDIPKPTQLTRHATGISNWQWSPDGKRIYFVSPDSIDRDERARTDKQFTVKPRNPAASIASLWVYDLDSRQERRLTNDPSYSVGEFTISPDGKWIGFHGMSANRYERGILEQNDYADLRLLNVATGNIERLTKNTDIGEGPVLFSPDSKLLAFSAPDDFKYMHNERMYVRHVDQPSEPLRKLGGNVDLDVRAGGRGGGGGGGEGIESSFWSTNGDTIYFGTGVRATTQLFSLAVASGQAKQVTDVKGTITVARDDETGPLPDHVRRPAHAAGELQRRRAARRQRPLEVDAAHRPERVGQARRRARRRRGDHVEVERRHEGVRRSDQTRRLPGGQALPADRRDPRRSRGRGHAQLQRRLQRASLCRRRLRGAAARTIASRRSTARSSRSRARATTSRKDSRTS